jgi:hypothetical protein
MQAAISTLPWHVDSLELMTDQLRRMDDQFGCGVCTRPGANQIG